MISDDAPMEIIRWIWIATLAVMFSALVAIAAYYREDLENHPNMGMLFMILGFVSTIIFFGGIFLYISGALGLSIMGLFA